MFQSLLFSIAKCHLFMFICFNFYTARRYFISDLAYLRFDLTFSQLETESLQVKKENEHKRKNNNNLYLYINPKIELVITKRTNRNEKDFP